MDRPVGAVSDRVRRFLRDASLYSVANVVPALLSLGALMLFSRVFAPEAFGRYSIALAVGGIASTLLYGWLDYAVLRYAPEFDARDVIRNTFSLWVAISVGFVAVALLSYALVGHHLGPYGVFFFAALALAVTRGALKPVLAFFRATLNPKRVTAFRVVKAAVGLGVAVSLALVVFDHIVGWVWGTVAGIVVTLVLVLVTTDSVTATPTVRRETVSRMFWYGVPMIGFIIGDSVLVQADRVLLEVLAGSAAVGVYTANYMLVDRGLRLAYTPLLQAITPIIIDSWSDASEREVREMLTEYTRYFLLLGVPVLFLVAVMSQTVARLLVGAEYRSGFVVIPIVALGLFMWSLANLGQVVFELKERTSVLSYGILGVIAVNLAINVPLIGRYGYIGAAVATTVSYGLYLGFVAWRSSRHIAWEFPMRCFRNTTTGGVLLASPTLALYAVDAYSVLGSIVTASLGVPIYLAAIYLLNEIKYEDIKRVQRTLG